MELIHKYFPNLTAEQQKQFGMLQNLYTNWNEKINVISRKDIEFLYEKHVLHSLAIAKFIAFKPQTKILDIGTGGGFPAIPLAIMFPEVEIVASDSVGKKITVVANIAKELGLTNIRAEYIRAEQLKETFDFVVNRAVESLTELHKHTYKFINKSWFNDEPNGIISLKGGDLAAEINGLKGLPYKIKVRQIPLANYFDEPYFDTKFLIYHTVQK
ncbi:MAG: 16S rRNA (guanine(527)-N(7))-methyltransferase RsmG [Bacteroidota bacterium]|nr:16S rRNA (guanine(527)-N(7))-methyltransferase RsmG [Bacteroidota bacterium]